MKKLKENIYFEVFEIIKDNYGDKIYAELEKEGIDIDTLYVNDALNFLADKEFEIYVYLDNGVEIYYKVNNPFEDIEITSKNIIKKIKEEENK